MFLLFRNEVSCDIQFGTVDGTLVYGHKIDLITGSSYFRAILSNFNETNKDLV